MSYEAARLRKIINRHMFRREFVTQNYTLSVFTVYIRGGEPAKHSGPHRLHNTISGPHLIFVFKLRSKNPKYYVSDLLNIHGELLLP